VSGAPGTGKTATLTHLLATRSGHYQAVFINCMVLKSSVAIYKEVAAQLCPSETVKTEKEALRLIEKTITSKGPMILLGKPIIINKQYHTYFAKTTSIFVRFRLQLVINFDSGFSLEQFHNNF
jgi:Ni2+-binding GTPase involved in maturation of urease and hydrogenase